MIRFLPEKNKKEIKFEYFSRIFVFGMIFMFLIGIFSVFTIFPSFIISYYRDISIEAQSQDVKKDIIDVSEQEKNVDKANVLSSYIMGLKVDTPSVEIERIVKEKTNTKITEITYQNSKEGYRYVVKGIASTREDLLLFVKKLKIIKDFSSVSLPVSDYVKSSDIDFSITILKK